LFIVISVHLTGGKETVKPMIDKAIADERFDCLIVPSVSQDVRLFSCYLLSILYTAVDLFGKTKEGSNETNEGSLRRSSKS
jgi:hypothetical protein